jgi:hypothetical protein
VFLTCGPAAKFLYRLGLQRFPPLRVIIDTASSSDASLRPIAIKYLIDNIPSRYSDYDPAKFSDDAYIPALAGNVARVGTPKEVTSLLVLLSTYFMHLTTFPEKVFASPEWASLGFLVVPSSLRDDALTKLKISEHPPASLLVALLEKTPPRNEAQAREWFGILAGRVAGALFFSDFHADMYADIPLPRFLFCSADNVVQYANSPCISFWQGW